jgi:hypothetical protein
LSGPGFLKKQISRFARLLASLGQISQQKVSVINEFDGLLVTFGDGHHLLKA